MVKTFPILLHPHTTLKAKAAEVANVDGTTTDLLNRMLATLYRADGVGLAANQVGLLQRLIVVDAGVEGKDGRRDYSVKKPLKLVNPKIVRHNDQIAPLTEGCLSLPHLWGDVERPTAVTVAYVDEHGSEHTLDAEGLLAKVLQHEIDHLDGILFIDRMSKLRRDMASKKWNKLRKDIIRHGDNFEVLAEEVGIIPAVGEA